MSSAISLPNGEYNDATSVVEPTTMEVLARLRAYLARVSNLPASAVRPGNQDVPARKAANPDPFCTVTMISLADDDANEQARYQRNDDPELLTVQTTSDVRLRMSVQWFAPKGSATKDAMGIAERARKLLRSRMGSLTPRVLGFNVQRVGPIYLRDQILGAQYESRAGLELDCGFVQILKATVPVAAIPNTGGVNIYVADAAADGGFRTIPVPIDETVQEVIG